MSGVTRDCDWAHWHVCLEGTRRIPCAFPFSFETGNQFRINQLVERSCLSLSLASRSCEPRLHLFKRDTPNICIETADALDLGQASKILHERRHPERTFGR